jgi:hypothetical protein
MPSDDPLESAGASAPVLAALALPASAAADAPAASIVASRLAGPAPLTVRFSAQAPVVDPGLAVTDALGGTSVAETVVRVQVLRLALTPAVVVFGKRVVLHGALVPGERGARVVLERRTGAGASWQAVKSVATTVSAGSTSLCSRDGAERRARIGDLRSSPTPLTVAPQLYIETGEGTAFLGAPILIHACPRANLGVRVTVLRGGRKVARVRGVLGGRFNVPTPGTERFLARVEVAGRTVTVPLRAGAQTLAVGSSGPDVLALRARLARLHVQVPAPSTTFGSELFDSVVAFQKATTGFSGRRSRRPHGSARRSCTGR